MNLVAESEKSALDKRIRDLIAGGETFVVEFKSDQKRLPDRELITEVVCMANGEGGTILLGVEDGGTVTGLHAEHLDNTLQMQGLLMNQTIPPLSCTVEVIDVDGKAIAVIDVPKSQTPVGTRNGTYKRRALRADGRPECVPYSLAEMMSHAVSVGAQDYALTSVPGLTWDDLDPAQFATFRRLAQISGTGADTTLATLSEIEIARALRVVSVGDPEPRPLMGALLLFGGIPALQRFAPTHEVLFQVSRTTHLIDDQNLTSGLFSSAEALMNAFESHDQTVEIDAGLVHVWVPLVPRLAIREAIANALVHRDYAMLGPIRLSMDETGVTVTNPGGFVEGVRLDNILDQSKPRSPVLAEAFKRAGLVERSGLGVRRMFEAVLRVGRSMPDYSRTSRTDVDVRFETVDIDIPLVRYFRDIEEEQGRPLPLADLMMLQTLRHTGQLTLRQAAELTQLSDTQTLTRLSALEELGLIERRGSARSHAYHLSSSTYRALMSPEAYVRIRGIDKVQQPNMVLDFIRANGTITRAQTASLCRIRPEQATVLLRSMVADGSLALQGERRGSHYVLGDGTSPVKRLNP